MVAQILYCLFELQHFAQIWKKEKVVTLCKRRLSCIIYDQQQMAVQIKFTFELKKNRQKVFRLVFCSFQHKNEQM
jgi:hypothetical protein